MKKVLKGWLIDNSVTADNKTDKILLLHSTGSLNLDDVLEEMQKQDTGLRPETMRHSVTLYNRILMDLILKGLRGEPGVLPSRCATDRRDRGRRMEQGEELHLRLPYAGQGVARGDRPDRGGDPRREIEYHVHPRDRG